MTLPFGFDGGMATYLAAALLVAAFIRGYTGFGFSAIFIAFAALVTNPVPLIPVVFTCEILMTAFQARGIRPHIDWRRVIALLAGAAVATIPAVTLMARLGPDMARLVVSTLIFLLALFLLSGWHMSRRIGMIGQGGVGVLAGLANGAGVGGLPVAAFLTAQPMAAAVFRATMIAFLTGVDLLALPVMAANGLVSAQTAIGAALAFPVLGLGIWLGGKRFTRASPGGFRRAAVYLLLGLSTITLFQVLL